MSHQDIGHARNQKLAVKGARALNENQRSGTQQGRRAPGPLEHERQGSNARHFAGANGLGSSVNGGELLFLALATCYCNDIYREAAKRGIRVESVEVEVAGEFGAAGEPATNVSYHARIAAYASADMIRQLANETDRVAEIQNTLRVVTQVTLNEVEPIPI